MSYLFTNSQRVQPLISIVIPAYNRLQYLLQAVASVLAQTYPNWELIIVDDGSTDGTKEEILLLNDKRLKVFTVAHCGNIALLRNAGVNISAGEWIAFLDSDDLWVPEKLQLQLHTLLQAGKAWCYAGFELMNETRQPIPVKTGKYIAHSGWITKELLTNKASVVIGSLLLQRKLFEELGGFDISTELVLREDYEFVLRLSLKEEALALSEILVRVREHPGRSTHAIMDGYKRTAFLYKHFAKNCSDKTLKRIARRRQAHHETEMAVKNIQQKEYSQAIRQFTKAFFMGDKLRHLLSALRRSTLTKKEIPAN